MATAICFYSKHHGNTKKLLDAIREAEGSVELIDITEQKKADLSGYDRIGFASGIYYGGFAKQLISFLRENLPENKPVFFLYSAGQGVSDGFCRGIGAAAKEKNAKLLGSYGCMGFDTFGPLKLIGGVRKGHPDAKEIRGAVDFYKNLG